MVTAYAFTLAGALGWFIGFAAGSGWKLYIHCRYHRSNDDRTESNGSPNRTDDGTEQRTTGPYADRLARILDADADKLRVSLARHGDNESLRTTLGRATRLDSVRRYNFRNRSYRDVACGDSRGPNEKAVK